MRIRTYSELIRIQSFEERLAYLQLGGDVGRSTFGEERFINQALYNSWAWRRTREKIILRDEACDLGIQGRDIYEGIRIHHMNPLTIEQIEDGDPTIFDPEFLICTSLDTHNFIHFGHGVAKPTIVTMRRKGDTKLW